jgi:hypothetical protein
MAQSALAKACASWPRVRRAADPDAYVRRIMLNANSARFRKRRAREQLTGAPPEPGCGQAGALTGGADDPVGFATLGNGRGQIQYGLVAPQVTRLVVRLGNGSALEVHPTEAYGQRYVAFAIPLPLEITRVAAYSGRIG